MYILNVFSALLHRLVVVVCAVLSGGDLHLPEPVRRSCQMAAGGCREQEETEELFLQSGRLNVDLYSVT